MSCGWQNNCQSRPCNHLQNVAATTYKNILQFYTKKACKKHPTIIAITDPKYRKEIAKLNAEVMGSNTDPYYGAPVVILVLADGSASTFVEDGSCVLENMMLAAHALGLGTVWVHREREIFDSESGKALLREWKLPETLRGVGAIALGYPAQEAGQPAARKQNYIVRI